MFKMFNMSAMKTKVKTFQNHYNLKNEDDKVTFEAKKNIL